MEATLMIMFSILYGIRYQFLSQLLHSPIQKFYASSKTVSRSMARCVSQSKNNTNINFKVTKSVRTFFKRCCYLQHSITLAFIFSQRDGKKCALLLNENKENYRTANVFTWNFRSLSLPSISHSFAIVFWAEHCCSPKIRTLNQIEIVQTVLQRPNKRKAFFTSKTMTKLH